MSSAMLLVVILSIVPGVMSIAAMALYDSIERRD